MEEDDNRVRVRVEYVVLSGPESNHNYPMLRGHGEQSFLIFARTPGRSGFTVDVYVCSELRYRYWGKVESVKRVLERDFDVSVLNLDYP